ncbi:MAG TPA: histidine kinase dimerization/phospho-acceptor domain-containing protein [Candidatus Polarisedimenticolia bacterium]|nr:histidine kinase dimerization/phospho-acceptor domain-containing protein [Candidatus Polarisedimenticolia bacterium]
MSPRRPAPVPEGSPADTVLVLEKSAPGASLAVALNAAGYGVRAVSTPAELSPLLTKEPCEILVLDLATAGRSRTARMAIDKMIAAFLDSGPERPPTILVVTDEASPATGPLAAAGLCLSVLHRDQVPRQVEAALALRRLEEARGEVARLREAVLFARSTAHDLAQPLTTILARTQLLLKNLQPDDPSRRAVGIVCQEAERLAKIIEGFQKLRTMAPSPAPPAE